MTGLLLSPTRYPQISQLILHSCNCLSRSHRYLHKVLTMFCCRHAHQFLAATAVLSSSALTDSSTVSASSGSGAGGAKSFKYSKDLNAPSRILSKSLLVDASAAAA